MAKEENEVKVKVDNEVTKLFKNPSEKICELKTYEYYKTFYLEPGDGYDIGSLFAFPTENNLEDLDKTDFKEMVLRQNASDIVYSNKKEEMLGTLPQLQKLIDDTKDTKCPVFMPILPSEQETGKDFQGLSPEAVEDKDCKFGKIHKQVANAFDMARLEISRLTKKDVPEKWLLYGRGENCKGLFRLWSLCPEKTSAICCNNSLENIVLPVMNHKNESLDYPKGFGNYKEITGIDGDDQKMLAQYRDTDVLYISNTYDIEKQKNEEQIKSKLKKLKFAHINIDRYDGTKVLDFSNFYQFRSEIYKETLIGKILKKIGIKGEKPQMLSAGADIEYNINTTKPGQLSEEEKEEYKNNYLSRKSSGEIAKARLAETIANGRTLGI